METIAVYWEETIRTYGFNLFDELMLYQINLSIPDAARWGGALQDLEEQDALFRMVWAQTGHPDRIKIHLLCDDKHWDKVGARLDPYTAPGTDTDGRSRTKVDVICFQGPHFGDRYGIMDFTLKALAKGQVPWLHAVCSVASIYLILPPGSGRKTQTLLSEAFEIPREKRDVGAVPKGRAGNVQ